MKKLLPTVAMNLGAKDLNIHSLEEFSNLFWQLVIIVPALLYIVTPGVNYK